MTGETVYVRPVEPSDEDFMEEMTYEAAVGGLSHMPSFLETMGEGRFSDCFQDWGRRGDGGLVAFTGEDDELGAAWHRIFPDKYEPIGESHSGTPQVVMAVREEARGQGVGRLLLTELMKQALEDGIHRLRLSVVKDNEPALHLYKSLGFTIKGDNPVTVVTESAWNYRMATQLTDKNDQINGEQECYTEIDYERLRSPDPQANTA